LNEYLSDSHRDKFVMVACNDSGPTCMYFNHFIIAQYKISPNFFEGYAITIMFGGDLKNLETLENDIRNKRPIVLIRVRVS
jgi:hypothetical protein